MKTGNQVTISESEYAALRSLAETVAQQDLLDQANPLWRWVNRAIIQARSIVGSAEMAA